MATKTLLIPSEKLISPSSWGSRQSIKTMIEKILYNYGTFITFASENSKLPKSVIASFIAVESGGNSKAGASGHITQGLMQWNRNYAKAQLEEEYADKRLTEAEQKKLASFGIKFTNGKTKKVTLCINMTTNEEMFITEYVEDILNSEKLNHLKEYPKIMLVISDFVTR